MKDKLIPALSLCLLLAVVAPVLAQVSANYDLSWHVVAGGGGSAADANHLLMGSIGQPLTGETVSSGHSLCGGFWCGSGVTPMWRVYLPLVLRSH